jgi:hypothetical protein
LWSATFLALATCGLRAEEELRFNRDIRPILADKCFHCHGPDAGARQADLRLDREADAHAERDGVRIITPRQSEDSELYQRITADDAEQRMPPASQERQLTRSEIELLRRWIEQGGEYEEHWAFIPPRRPALPELNETSWPRNPIDHFVLRRLKAEGLQPSPPADQVTLLRRVTLDLTGLPPTPAEVDTFLSDPLPGAYERAVDRLLQSPGYGERMALVWLDAARFADSGGYQGDILRSMWLWRDWVIKAYNAGMPFDQFTTEQLAGDLLPSPTRAQRIATGFNRNHRINDEDGIVHEEFRVEYVVDRVETTATVWLGLTMGCARCHDHKYDPISQREFYQFYAYFNSINESGRGHGNSPPLLHVTTPDVEKRLKAIDDQITRLTEAGAERAKKIAELKKQRDAIQQQVPTTMVMEELAAPRKTFVLIRGGYDQPSDQVSHGVPVALGDIAEDSPTNRLGLARWLLDPSHPLTARVAVNRYWQMYFGRGLVETPEDFGTQGALPSHPELLDWLATEFIRLGWDVKGLQRLVVTSATYRQSSTSTETLVGRDPRNRLLARGPRFRLSAETIRDQALAASGLLVSRIGGASVKPYQPPKLWVELASASRDYQESKGPDLYRRSLYTFVRRTVPPPAMITFDAPNREICNVRRPRTNTPLQALALMNDPTFVEAARVLAGRVVREVEDDSSRITRAFRLLMARHPSRQELETLRGTLQFYREGYTRDANAVDRLLSVGESKIRDEAKPADTAALTAVVMVIMNLDETITKE